MRTGDDEETPFNYVNYRISDLVCQKHDTEYCTVYTGSLLAQCMRLYT